MRHAGVSFGMCLAVLFLSFGMLHAPMTLLANGLSVPFEVRSAVVLAGSDRISLQPALTSCVHAAAAAHRALHALRGGHAARALPGHEPSQLVGHPAARPWRGLEECGPCAAGLDCGRGSSGHPADAGTHAHLRLAQAQVHSQSTAACSPEAVPNNACQARRHCGCDQQAPAHAGSDHAG